MKINFVQLCTLSFGACPQVIESGHLAGPILPITFPFHTAPLPTAPPPTASPPTAPPSTVVCPQVGTGSLVGAVIGTFIGTSLLYAVILLVWVLWNKRHRYCGGLLSACAASVDMH